MLGKVRSTMQRLGLMTEEELQRCAALEAAVTATAARLREEELLLEDAPEEFVDSITATLMKDPVRLPTRYVGVCV